jgi:hypothetical protein
MLACDGRTAIIGTINSGTTVGGHIEATNE